MYAIPEVLQALRETAPPGGRVLSAFLDTSPRRVAGAAYLLAFRDGCKTVRANLPPAEHDRFEAAVAQAEQALRCDIRLAHPGLALFASGAPDYFYTLPLPKSPAEDVVWAGRPEVEPLQDAVDEFERIGVVLFDKERTRLFTLFLGQLEEHAAFEDDVPGKQATGDWFALSQTRYARHHEEHVARHAKRTVRVLLRALRTHPFDRLLIAGPAEAVQLLRERLPRPLRARFAGTLRLEMFASDADVAAAAQRAAEALERSAEVGMVDELLEARDAPNVALGVTGTLDALAAGRVHLLLVADSFQEPGAECPACARLVAGPRGCPACGTATVPVPDLREHAVQQALAQGARVEVVSAAAAERLAAEGGLAAWTRY